MSFKDCTDKYRSVNFHFLDGLLNTTSGGFTEDVLSTLRDITPGLLPEDITFGKLSHQANLESTLTFIDKSSKLIFNHDLEENIQIPVSLFKFCIIPIVYNKHQTTIIIFTKENKMYLYILNSGLDISYNGNTEEIDSQDLYQLTKGIIICDNINTKLDEAYNFMKKIFLISYVYNHIDKNLYIKKEWYDYFFSDDFKKLLPLLIKNNSIYNNIFIYNELLKELDFFEKNLNTTLDKSFDIKINKNYYILASNLINENTVINIGSIENININQYNKDVIPQLIRDKLSESFLKKIILYNKNNNLYIYSQESGSCTWYSIYFSILLYYIVHDSQPKYIEFIKEINNKFYDYILKVYTKENFKRELQNDKRNYIYMKKLCSKLIDIKLIDSKILYDNLDLLYDTEFSLSLTENESILQAYKYTESDNDINDNMKYMTNFFKEINDYRVQQTDAINIFNKKKNNFFKHEIDLTEFKNIINGVKDKDYKNIKEIKNLIKIFEDTYLIQLSEKIPSYLTYYIPIILYYNNFIKPKLNLNFEENAQDLFDCCLLHFRLKIISFIFIEIIENITSHSNNNILIKNLIDNIIIKDKEDFKFDSLEYLKYIKSDLTKLINKKNYENTMDIYKIFHLEIKHEKKQQYNMNQLFDIFMEKFDILIDIENFLFENKTFITREYLTYNIYRINEDQKKELINFYCKICYNYEKPMLELVDTIYNFTDQKIEDSIHKLYILLFECPEYKEYTGYKYNFAMKFYTLNIKYFTKRIEDLKKKNINDFNNFYSIIINQKDKIFKDEFRIIPDYNYKNTKIKNKEFRRKYIKQGIFSIDKFTKLLIEDTRNQNLDIYQIIGDNYIRYYCSITNRYDEFKFKILEIYVNDNKVLKFNDIIYPFKYLIPNTDINLIYEENGVYNIACNFYWSSLENSLLGENKFDQKIIYQINPNNQFFLNKFSSDSNFKKWNLLCLNNQLNGYNILYVNFNNTTTDTNGYSSSNKYASIFNFDKKSIFEEEINYQLTGFTLLNPISNGQHLLEFKIDDIKDRTESYKKLLFKISECNINETNKPMWIQKFNLIKQRLESKIIRFTEFIKNLTLGDLINNYPLLQSYLLNIKILNFIKKILLNIDEQNKLCSLTKNYNNLFDTKQRPYKYKFEILFELINGNEILKEQMERYKIMIDSYDNYILNKRGGGVAQTTTSAYVHNSPSQETLVYNDDLIQYETSLIDTKINLEYSEEQLPLCKSANYYQLHHFMMGKGKSAIITPLLSLYLTIIKKKKIYIIVPKHLVKQTEATLKDYLDIFQIENILIRSEDDIKNDFLEGKFLEDESISNNNIVFLIDEFDSLINPLKSNFNFIEENLSQEDINTDDIRNIIRNIIDNNFNTRDKFLEEIRKYESIFNGELLADNILSIIEQLNNNEIKFNINWGMDSDKLFAIPYRGKDKPIENSSFTSIIKTLFLSYYYYIKIKNYQIDDNIYNYLKYKYEIFKSFFMKPLEQLSIELINQILNEEPQIKINFFNLLFNEIFGKIKLPIEQYNTSFIDIINIDNIFKIGYSGTVNINLPNLVNTFKFHQDCKYPDADESTNIENAIINSHIYAIDKLINFTDHNALIDVCGFFYDSSNYKIAFELYEIFKTNIIFIDEKDEKMVINKYGLLEKLNENIIYENPFFYYDQAHIVGIDIKQDNYPVLHGLCIVDNLSYYSEVAQAMFRLRKLNFGHQISFILNNFNIGNKHLLLEHFRRNENNLKEQQKNNLNLQALKSDTRKKRDNPIFKERYKEQIFYYFREDNLNKNPLELICRPSEIQIDLKQYELDLEGIKKIIFDLDFNISSIQHQQQTQTQTQKLTQTQMQTQNLLAKIDSINLNGFNKFLFKNFDFIINIKNIDDFNKSAIIIDDIISFLPNIFFDNWSGYMSKFKRDDDNYYHEYNKYLMFVYIHTVEKFILIPIFMVIYLYKKFLIFDLNLNIINEKLRININYEKIKQLKDSKNVKIITNNYTQDEITSYEREYEINNEEYNKESRKLSAMERDKLIHYDDMMKKKRELFDRYQNIFFPFLISCYLVNLSGDSHKYPIVNRIGLFCIEYFSFKIKNHSWNISFMNDFNDLIRKDRKIDDSQRKYLKYKAKYLNLKKLFN
jgi:hypothetical protein